MFTDSSIIVVNVVRMVYNYFYFNSLPVTIRLAISLRAFKQLLKTFAL